MRRTKIVVTMEQDGPPASAGKENRLARIYTELSLQHPQKIALDLRHPETLSLAIPALLKQARSQADKILAEENHT